MTKDIAQHLDDLKRSRMELSTAYQATIEGWVHALGLRDKEAEGHSRRVSDLALRLAREMGFGDEQLTHIRRGSLLHDIGKIGIPDAVLLKPGPLTREEWAVMHQHPIHGYMLLSPIEFLTPALDIVYCHHERWDGCGYPRGLRGEEASLPARLFSVVNVWDALVSNQPYRRGISGDAALVYIKEQAGKQFDPEAVKAFVAVVGN